MKKTTAEVCPGCLTPVPTGRTTSIDVSHTGDAYRGKPIKLYRVRERRCPRCGLLGMTTLYISETEWSYPENGEAFTA